MKQTFLILCASQSFDDIIYEQFVLVADHNRCVSRIRFETMIRTLSKILSYLGEEESFINIPNIVHRCFEPCIGIVGLNEYQFNCLWKGDHPDFGKFSNIMRLTSSIKDSKNVWHENIKCISCSMNPIQGLRFKCQKCSNVSLCLTCFSSGYATRNHNVTHRMYEIGTHNIPTNKIVEIFSKLINIFRCCRERRSIIQTNQNQITTDRKTQLIEKAVGTDVELKSIESNQNSTFYHESLFNTTVKADLQNSTYDPMDKLIAITEVLMTQNITLEQNLNSKQKDINKILQNHIKVLALQIEELRQIHSKSYVICLPPSSTPLRQERVVDNQSNNLLNTLSRLRHGVDINKTYMDFNKTDISIKDVSIWFSHTKMKGIEKKIEDNSAVLTLGTSSFNIETQMHHFKDLLVKVKEIVDGKC